MRNSSQNRSKCQKILKINESSFLTDSGTEDMSDEETTAESRIEDKTKSAAK